MRCSNTTPTCSPFRGVVVAACLVLVAGCGAEAVPAPTGTTPDAPVETPLTPTDLVATPGNAQVNLTWSAISGATSYQVRRSTTGGGPYTQIATTTSPSYTDSTVSNDTSYYYVVAAVNSPRREHHFNAGRRDPRDVTARGGHAAGNSSAPWWSQPPPVTPPPTGLPSGPGVNFTSAPAWSNVTMVQNRDSVIIQVPAVANARGLSRAGAAHFGHGQHQWNRIRERRNAILRRCSPSIRRAGGSSPILSVFSRTISIPTAQPPVQPA